MNYKGKRMKKDFKNISILLFSTLLFLGCSDNNQFKTDKSEIKVERSLDVSENQFDFDFLKNIDASKKENIYFAPYSLKD